MDSKEFDEIIKQKFEEEQLKTPPGEWSLLSEKTPTGKGVYLIPYYYKIAAGLLIILGLFISTIFIWNPFGKRIFRSSLVIKNKNLQEQKENLLPAQKAAVANTFFKKQNVTDKFPQAPNTTVFSQHFSHDSKNKELAVMPSDKSSQQVIPSKKANSTLETTATFFKKSVVGFFSEKKAVAKENAANPNNIKVNTSGNSVAGNYSDRYKKETMNNTFLEKSNSDSHIPDKTALSVNGGMGFGSLSAGYTLGIGARQAIGKHFFVEGQISFLYNNQASDASNYPGPPTTPSRPSSFSTNTVRTPSMTAVPDFYYLQVNPSVGYRINKIIAVSVGADLQQRITNMSGDGTAIYTPATDPRIIPKLDFGLTGKTEFFLNRKMDVGILYRDGLNNLIQPAGVFPYLNRHYIQLRLKYNFLLH